jgi:hypothetical protein
MRAAREPRDTKPLPDSGSAPPPIGSPEEAEQVIVHLLEVMDALLMTVQEETQLVRAGHLRAAAQLEQPKAELARLYIADLLRLRANQAYLAETVPATLDSLRRRHDTFRALLQINLTVLATAHAVSEGIVRGVSSELARQAAPQTYGASGRPNGPRARASHPLAVSRSL